MKASNARPKNQRLTYGRRCDEASSVIQKAPLTISRPSSSRPSKAVGNSASSPVPENVGT